MGATLAPSSWASIAFCLIALGIFFQIGVSIIPGWTEFTRILSGAYWIAAALEKNFPSRAESEPELLAHHFDAGQEPERAAHLWHRAGRQSLGRSAVAEAFAQAEQGIAALERIEPSHERDSLEIDLQSCLALASMVYRGYAAEETERAYLRARELLGAFDNDPRLTSFKFTTQSSG